MKRTITRTEEVEVEFPLFFKAKDKNYDSSIYAILSENFGLQIEPDSYLGTIGTPLRTINTYFDMHHLYEDITQDQFTEAATHTSAALINKILTHKP